MATMTALKIQSLQMDLAACKNKIYMARNRYNISKAAIERYENRIKDIQALIKELGADKN